MPLTPFPPAPSRAAPLEFADKADAWLSHFENPFVPEFNAAQADINLKQQQSTIAAAQATQASSAAAESAAQSLAFSQAAATSANVTPWQSGTTYQQGQVVFSLVDFHSYRRRTTGAGTTDPFFDQTNWQKLTGVDEIPSARYFEKLNPAVCAFGKTGVFNVTVTAGFWAEVNSAVVYVPTGAAVTMPGTATQGTDYAIWLRPNGTLEASASFISPPVANSRRVGGFHYAPGGNAPAQAGGNNVPQINEFSMWDQNFRPACPDPRGMALIADGFWMDIYLTGVNAAAQGSSRFSVTIANGSSPPIVPTMFGGNGSTSYGSYTWFEAMELATAFGKRCPTQQEFMAAAYGTTEAASFGTDPVSTILRQAYTSRWGIMLATGNMWIWGQQRGGPFAGPTWNASTEGRGSELNAPNAELLGGSGGQGSTSGSRCSFWNSAPTLSSSIVGSRFCCDHLQLG